MTKHIVEQGMGGLVSVPANFKIFRAHFLKAKRAPSSRFRKYISMEEILKILLRSFVSKTTTESRETGLP